MPERVFGPASSHGVLVNAGSIIKARIRQESGSTQTLKHLRFGVAQLEPQGAGLVPLPKGVAAGWQMGDGSVFVGGGDQVIRKIDADGGTVWTTASLGATINDLVTDPDGNVYALVGGNGEVHKYNTDGGEVWVHDDTLTSTDSTVARRLAVDVDRNVYVVHSPYISKLDSDGVQLWEHEHTETIGALAHAAEGFLYVGVSINSFILKFDTDGNEITDGFPAQGGTQHNPRGMAAEPSDWFYVGNSSSSGTDSTHKFASSGAVAWSFDSGNANAYGIAVDDDQNLYVSGNDGTSPGVFKIDAAGGEVWFAATDGLPLCIAVDPDHNVFAGIGTSNRLYKFDSEGNELWQNNDPTGSVNGVGVVPGHFGSFG